MEWRTHTDACGASPETSGHGDLPDGPGGKSERQRIDDEGPFIAQASGAEAGQQRAYCEGGRLRGLCKRVGSVKFVVGGDGGENGGAARAEKRRGEHQGRAEQVQQPGARLVNGEDEGERDGGANEVA